jgi:ABC-type nitrate/sulfonate/bicarbonate transport system substrate-binding protein
MLPNGHGDAAANSRRSVRVYAAVRNAFIVLWAGVAIAPASAQQLVPFRIGSQSPPIFEYVYINYAINGGFLRKEGIDGKFVGFTAGLTSTQALAGGSVDAACDGFTGTVAAIAKGSPAKAVYAVNSDNTYVVVSRDTITKPEDLRRKKFAITQMGAISQTYAALWMSKNGLPDGTVDWIPIGGTSARARAVIANQVDVTLLTVGEWVRIREQPGVRLLATLSDTVPPLPLNLCAASTKMINERPDVVQKVVNGILNAVRHARTPEGREQYIKTAREIDPTGYTDKQYEELYDYYFGPKGNPLAVDPNGGLYPEVYVNNMKSMVAEKTVDAVVPLEKLWDPRFVNAYLGENGWYDAATRKSGMHLRDMLKR